MSSLYEFDTNRVAGSGNFTMGTAGHDIGDRKVCYLGADGFWYRADAAAVATMPVIGLTIGAITSGRQGPFLLKGFIGLFTWTWTVGGEIYASTASGELSQTPPGGVGASIQVVGWANLATQMYFDPKGAGAGDGCAILEGAAAYVGFNDCREPYTNYFLCDGTADNVQIQAAITYVGTLGGGLINFEEGDYDISVMLTLTGVASRLIHLEGTKRTRFTATAAAGLAAVLQVTDSHKENMIKGITFDGNADNGGAAYGIWITSPNGITTTWVDVLQNSFRDCDVGIKCETQAGGGACEHILIQGNQFGVNNDANDVAIETENCKMIRIVDNILEDCNDIHINIIDSSTKILVLGNHFDDAANYAVRIQTSSTENVIADNLFEDTTTVDHIKVEDGCDNNIIGGNISDDTHPAGNDGISVLSDGNVISDNSFRGMGRYGLFLSGEYNTVVGNNFSDNTNNGINADNADFSTISDNIVEGNVKGIYLTSTCISNVVKGNIIRGNSNYGIQTYSPRTTIVGNQIDLNGATAIWTRGDGHVIDGNVIYKNTGNAIELNQADQATISNNVITSDDTLQTQGILTSEATELIVVGNQIYGNTGSGIRLNNLTFDAIIMDNELHNNGAYGVWVAANCLRNVVKNNRLHGNATGFINDLAPDTIFATMTLSFVDGTLFLSAAPFGWEIDANTEYAIALGTVPAEAQQVRRWKIWATSLLTEADAMRLEIEGYGGASNEPYTTETVAVANHPSTTTNFAVNDVIYWLLTASNDADLDDMVGGDQIMIKVLHEAAGGDDCETDAVFTCVEIDYV